MGHCCLLKASEINLTYSHHWQLEALKAGTNVYRKWIWRRRQVSCYHKSYLRLLKAKVLNWQTMWSYSHFIKRPILAEMLRMGDLIGELQAGKKAKNDENLDSESECIYLKRETGHNSHLRGRTYQNCWDLWPRWETSVENTRRRRIWWCPIY